MKSRKSSELWTAWRQFCLVSWLPFLTTSEPSKRCGMAPSTPTPTIPTLLSTSRRCASEQRHWSRLASTSSRSSTCSSTCPHSVRWWALPSANLETRASNRYIQTLQDKVRHLLLVHNSPQQATGINVRSVLKNLGNSLFNGHWDLLIGTEWSWEKQVKSFCLKSDFMIGTIINPLKQ